MDNLIGGKWEGGNRVKSEVVEIWGHLQRNWQTDIDLVCLSKGP